jgi:MoxR-like ATPase
MNGYENNIRDLRTSVAKTILGKDDVIEQILVCLIAEGHILIEDVPGVGKTTLALALAKSIDGLFQRVQFTSDLLPSDVLGVTIYNSDTHHFEFKPGPIFTNILLADEINRTTPKTQSALLEAMQDGAVTVERQTHAIPKPFMVIATQNPIEFHGTYPLPESQLDRFLMRIQMGYPSLPEEFRILETKGSAPHEVNLEPVCSGAKVIEMQRASRKVKVDKSVTEYLLRIVTQTRKVRDLELGGSPRATLNLYRAAQARAFVHDRAYVTPDDIKALAVPVLAHRVIVSGRRRSTPTSRDSGSMAEVVLKEILGNVEVPA